MSDSDSFANRQVQARAGQSPDRIDLPFWVDACLHLTPPKRKNGRARSNPFAVLEVARALMADRIRARGDEDVQLDRAAISRWARAGHARNCGWIVRYLQQIGFLEVHAHPSATGQLPDTFDVFVAPPANYIGPTTYAELDMAIQRQADGVQTPVFLQVNPSSANAELGADPKSSNAELGQVNPSSANAELGADPKSSNAELGQVNPSSANAELASSSTTSSTEEVEVEEVGVGESATPPADAGADAAALHDDENDWALALALQLPWSRRLRNRKPSWGEVRKLAARFRVANADFNVAADEVQQRALEALDAANPSGRKANPVAYVINRFAADRLRADAPVTETLTLPSEVGAAEPEPEDPDEDEDDSDQLPPWCGECNGGAEAARHKPRFRYYAVTGEKCWCHPKHASRVPEAEQQPGEADQDGVAGEDVPMSSPAPEWVSDAQYAQMSRGERTLVRSYLDGTLLKGSRRSLNETLFRRGLELVGEPDPRERARLRVQQERRSTPQVDEGDSG